MGERSDHERTDGLHGMGERLPSAERGPRPRWRAAAMSGLLLVACEGSEPPEATSAGSTGGPPGVASTTTAGTPSDEQEDTTGASGEPEEPSSSGESVEESGSTGEEPGCTPPRAPGLPAGAEGRLEERSLLGPVTGLELEYTIYLPPGYDDSDSGYPVLYHLHGVGGNPRESTIIAAFEDAMQAEVIGPMVLVFPYSQPVQSFWLDSEESAVESWVMEDLIPHLESSRKVIAGPGTRSVSGFSMGGFGAMLYGTKYPDRFAAAVSYDGAVHIGDRSTPFVHATENRDAIVEGITLAAAVGNIVEPNRMFHDHLESLAIPLVYFETACGHDPGCILEERGLELWGAIHGAMDPCR